MRVAKLMKKFLQPVARGIVRFFAHKANIAVLVFVIGAGIGKALEMFGLFGAWSTFPLWNSFILILVFYVSFVMYTNHCILASVRQPILVRFFALQAHKTILVFLSAIVVGKVMEAFGIFAELSHYQAWFVFLAVLAMYVVLAAYTLIVRLAGNAANGNVQGQNQQGQNQNRNDYKQQNNQNSGYQHNNNR